MRTLPAWTILSPAWMAIALTMTEEAGTPSRVNVASRVPFAFKRATAKVVVASFIPPPTTPLPSDWKAMALMKLLTGNGGVKVLSTTPFVRNRAMAVTQEYGVVKLPPTRIFPSGNAAMARVIKFTAPLDRQDEANVVSI